MSSPLAKGKQSSRWGSLLSGAVAGIESRLDTILAEDSNASAKSRAEEKASLEAKAASAGVDKEKLAPPSDASDTSRSSSRNRVNERLQERLAKAVSDRKGLSQTPSESPSRTASPLVGESPRASLSSRPSADVPRSVVEEEVQVEAAVVNDLPERPLPDTLLESALPINPARLSAESNIRPSLDSAHRPSFSSEPPETNGTHIDAKSNAEFEAEINELRSAFDEAEKLRQEEMLANLERIDALQAKLQYLAKESVAAAKEANENAAQGSLEQKLAEKDEKVALLMEEGQNLSKAEMRHLATIRKLRAKIAEDDKSTANLKKELSRLGQAESELKQKLKRSEQSERSNTEKLKVLPKLEADLKAAVEGLENEKSNTDVLRRRLSEEEKRADQAEQEAQKAVQESDSKKVLELQDALSDARIERKLADDRATAEIKRLNEETARQKGQASSLELELRSEISNLESKMETLRYRAEEASSDTAGDSQAKLLRQIETLQTQYSLAAENWRSIEGSLNARVTAIEKERDEATKREADVRKKARELGSKSRQAEQELEATAERSRKLNDSLELQRGEVKKVQARLDVSEEALEEAKSDLERQRRLWEQRLEEERHRSQAGVSNGGQMPASKQQHTSPATSHHRKTSALDTLVSVPPRRSISRVFSGESNSLTPDRMHSRRSSTLTTPILAMGAFSGNSPTISRPESTLSMSHFNGTTAAKRPSLSVRTTDVDADADDNFDGNSSPHQTVNDVISASTVHTGPSVQLVERMSSSIRRLESEKAAHKDELARLLAQRDEARNEVVAMMREAEGKKVLDDKTSGLEKELGEVKARYEACLDVLGEKEEEVLELKGDVDDLKAMYRELAEKMK